MAKTKTSIGDIGKVFENKQPITEHDESENKVLNETNNVNTESAVNTGNTGNIVNTVNTVSTKNTGNNTNMTSEEVKSSTVPQTSAKRGRGRPQKVVVEAEQKGKYTLFLNKSVYEEAQVLSRVKGKCVSEIIDNLLMTEIAKNKDIINALKNR